MRIYVAGKYCERFFVKEIYKLLEERGHEITVDWTNHNVYPNDSSPDILATFADDDLRGVLEADLFIGDVLNQHEYKGLWVEMGIALGKGIPVWLIGENGDACIFSNHHTVRKFKGISEMLKALESPSGVEE